MHLIKTKFKTRIVVLSGLLLGASQGHAKGGSEIMETIYENIIPIVAGLVIIAALITLINMIFSFIELQKMRMQQEMGIAKEKVVSSLNLPSWNKISNWMWSLVPKDKEQTIDLGHNYDGIRELDNKLPPWWLGLLYGTIVFAAVYMYYYEWGPNEWSSIQEYEIEMEDAKEQQRKFLARSANSVDENTVVFVADESQLAKGAEIYTLNCAACHGPEGQGVVGPNLTDDYWVHGGSISDIFKTIKYGVPEKGMIAWGSQLKPTTIQNLSSFIQTLKGSNPPNPKAKEGDLYTPEEHIPMGENEETNKKNTSIN